MQIKGSTQIQAVRAYAAYNKVNRQVQQPVAEDRDILDLSPESKVLRELVSEASRPVEREELIQDLRERLKSGTYQVPVEKLAAKLMDEISLEKK